MGRDWTDLYNRFRDLWSRYTRAHRIPQIGRQVLRQAINPKLLTREEPISTVKDLSLVERDRDLQPFPLNVRAQRFEGIGIHERENLRRRVRLVSGDLHENGQPVS